MSILPLIFLSPALVIAIIGWIKVSKRIDFPKEKKRAISPVIATVILVAVAITLSVAVAWWMGGIASSYTKFEKLDLVSIRSDIQGTGWNITITARNQGPTDIRITDIYVNDVSISQPNLTILVGDTQPIVFSLSKGKLTSGTTIDCRLHTATGADYHKLVVLV